ncbi:MAG: hypothetical protein WKF37_10455 [Bryobacteraceae bacterium]
MLTFRKELIVQYQRYLADQSRHQKVLLDEVVGAYMRADPKECLATLRSMNALGLVSSDPLGGIFARIDLDDFNKGLAFASEKGNSIGEDLIRKGFDRKAQADPEAAFEDLKSVPGYLREELSTRLARIWGKSKGKEAADAFLKYNGVLQWRNQFGKPCSAGLNETLTKHSGICVRWWIALSECWLADRFICNGMAYVKPFEAAQMLPAF